MTGEVYLGMTHRTFEQAVLHLLESEYGLLGSQRVLGLLAEDLQHLVAGFYPAPERLAPGWILWTGIKAEGAKANPNCSCHPRELVTLAWPWCLPEDLQELAEQGESSQVRETQLRKRLRRLIEHGLAHSQGPVVLTVADLAVLFGRNSHQISALLQEVRRESGEPLPTMGYIFDQGMRPTHKVLIITLYEGGLDEAEVARQSGHAALSVGQYIRDYERVKLLLTRGISQEQIPTLIGMQPNMVQAYAELVAQFHPDLLAKMVPSQ